MRPNLLPRMLQLPAPIRQSLFRRTYAVQAPGGPTLQVFNEHTKWLQKERAAVDIEASRRVDYLRDEVASRLCERLLVRATSPFEISLRASYFVLLYSLEYFKLHAVLMSNRISIAPFPRCLTWAPTHAILPVSSRSPIQTRTLLAQFPTRYLPRSLI